MDRFGQLNVVPNSNPLGKKKKKRFVSSISRSLKYECCINMQMHHTKNFSTELAESVYWGKDILNLDFLKVSQSFCLEF